MVEIVEEVQKDGRVVCKIVRDGWHLGTWTDTEWDGRCPHAEIIRAAIEKAGSPSFRSCGIG